MNVKEKGHLHRLKSLLHSIKVCTQPIDGHSDPNSVNDCWKWVDDILNKLCSDNETPIPKPHQIRFYSNGNVVAFDCDGQQIGVLQENVYCFYFTFLEGFGLNPEEINFVATVNNKTKRCKAVKQNDGLWNVYFTDIDT